MVRRPKSAGHLRIAVPTEEGYSVAKSDTAQLKLPSPSLRPAAL